jgi:hypothetical protein
MQKDLSLASKLWIWGPSKNRAQKLENFGFKFIKEKLKKIEGPLTSDGHQMKPGAARAFNPMTNRVKETSFQKYLLFN